MNIAELPRQNARLNLTRQYSEYSDVLSVVNNHFKVHQDLEQFLGPYNAKQRSQKIYVAPTRDQIRSAVRQYGMNDLSYSAMLTSSIRFCESTKGLRALPTPHPSTIHSIQLPMSAFEFTPCEQRTKLGSHELRIPGCEALYLSGLRTPEKIKFVIVRPRLSRLGTPSPKEWEVLLFYTNHGYIANWADTTLNPRWSGML